ncbi:unnamed protein product [Strongylus vulgaris]|uniref:DUF4708 domain-containing protein n=1 Tax=Strongylus vulgaris TaxID=40348 RepID=A0A3P7JJB9_STRVU|nr:unnamed protein product [Strongylus vulgaris]
MSPRVFEKRLSISSVVQEMFIELCTISLEECITYHLQIDQSIEDRSAAPRAVQRKLCREAAQLFEHHGAIVAPQQDYEVFVIVARCTFLEGKEFLDWLHDKFLKIVGTNRADTQMIEKCLHYTLTLWLAPHHYYTVGKTLVTGLIFGAAGPKLIRLNVKSVIFLDSQFVACPGKITLSFDSQARLPSEKAAQLKYLPLCTYLAILYKSSMLVNFKPVVCK